MMDRIARAVELLEARFGEPPSSVAGDPLKSLVVTILSQNTTDTNRDRAFQALQQRYPSWDDVLHADEQELAEVIKVAGLSNQRSKRIINLLQWAKERFAGFNLAEICSWDYDRALKELGHLPGVGVKTISVMLLFACGHDLCPVDTHVFRVVGRLGWVGAPKSRDDMFRALQGKFPKGKGLSLHINLIRLGRQICKPRNPLCPECPLIRNCEYFRELGEGDHS
jgi:endonuclease-3